MVSCIHVHKRKYTDITHMHNLGAALLDKCSWILSVLSDTGLLGAGVAISLSSLLTLSPLTSSLAC